MRILFTFIGGSGHFRPLVPFARAAQAAGRTVRNASFARVRRAGCATARQGGPGNRARMEAGRHRARRDRLRLRDRRRDTRRCVRERHRDVGRRPARREVIADPIAALRKEWGLAPGPELNRLDGGLVIMPAPPSLRDPCRPLPEGTFWCAPGCHVPRRTRTTGKPLIYFTLGMLDTHRRVVKCVLAGLRDLPVRVVTTVGRRLDPASFGPQPEHVRIEQFIPRAKFSPKQTSSSRTGHPARSLVRSPTDSRPC